MPEPISHHGRVIVAGKLLRAEVEEQTFWFCWKQEFSQAMVGDVSEL